jgi:hypothetical protein
MKAEHIVTNLLENDVYGPPAPDNFTNAVGSTRQLRSLHRQAAAKMIQMDSALQIERQLRKAGVTRDQVSSYIRADQAYPKNYSGVLGVPMRRGTLPADAIVGMHLEDGREIMFDLAVIPEKE